MGGRDGVDHDLKPAEIKKKVHETPSQQKKSWGWFSTPVIPATEGRIK
jgi:hypothetical protein